VTKANWKWALLPMAVIILLCVGCVTTQTISHTPEGFKPLVPELCSDDMYRAYRDVHKLSKKHGSQVWVQLQKELNRIFSNAKKKYPKERKLIASQEGPMMRFFEYTCKNAKRLNTMTFPEFKQKICGAR
jgi:hypothetical protein